MYMNVYDVYAGLYAIHLYMILYNYIYNYILFIYTYKYIASRLYHSKKPCGPFASHDPHDPHDPRLLEACSLRGIWP